MQVREAVVRTRREGFAYRQIAEMLGIGYATVNRILRLHRETSAVVPRPVGGGNVSAIRGDVADKLVKLVAERPDATVAELTTALMSSTGLSTSRSGVQRALGRLGF